MEIIKSILFLQIAPILIFKLRLDKILIEVLKMRLKRFCEVVEEGEKRAKNKLHFLKF